MEGPGGLPYKCIFCSHITPGGKGQAGKAAACVDGLLVGGHSWGPSARRGAAQS